MAFCIKCGSRLRQGVNYCEQCGHPVAEEGYEDSPDTDELDEDLADDEFDEDDKDIPSDCYATFEGRCVSIIRANGTIFRQIYVHHEVIGAQVSGQNVAITCEDGWFYLYRLDGTIIRETRQ